MGKFSRRTSAKSQPSGHSCILVGGWWFIFSNLSGWLRDAYWLEIRRGEVIWEQLCEQQISELRTIWKGKNIQELITNLRQKCVSCHNQVQHTNGFITAFCFSRWGHFKVHLMIVSCKSVCCVWPVKSYLKVRFLCPCDVASSVPLVSARWQCYIWPIVEAESTSVHPFSD